MKMSPESIASLLRERRKALALVQQDVAQMAGVSLHTLHNLESGKGNPTLEVIAKVLEVLGLELQIRARALDVNAP